ncbi:cytochrome c [Acidobacteria bacterium AH-259-D05]|nr:cytochrome c [Acidobacteria bacterium AH-259-D05]
MSTPLRRTAMHSKNHQTLLALAVVVTALVAGGQMGGAATQEGDATDRGRADFIEMGCYQCHGYQGQGGAGPRLVPDPLSFEAFARVVRRPPNVMSAYSSKVLSDEKLKRIHQYLESMPKPPEVSSLPALSGE